MSSLSLLVRPFAGLALLTLGCGCKRLNEQMPITEQRDVSSFAKAPQLFVSSEERFAEANRPEQPEQPERPEPAVEQPQQKFFDYATPPGWVETAPPPSNGMAGVRLINMRFGAQKEGECYLTLMLGQAGGLAANINRWRSQMGQESYTPEQIDQLPLKPFLNHQAVYVDFGGDFKAVGAQQALKGYHLLGLLMEAPKFTIFVKMTGPEALVVENKKAFEQFCQSITSVVPTEQ